MFMLYSSLISPIQIRYCQNKPSKKQTKQTNELIRFIWWTVSNVRCSSRWWWWLLITNQITVLNLIKSKTFVHRDVHFPNNCPNSFKIKKRTSTVEAHFGEDYENKTNIKYTMQKISVKVKIQLKWIVSGKENCKCSPVEYKKWWRINAWHETQKHT